MKKNCKRQIEQSLELKKWLGENVINYMSNRKAMLIRVIVRFTREMYLYKISQYFPKRYKSFGKNVELDLFNYVTKADLNVATGVDTSNLAAKSDLARLKSEIVKTDKEKLKTVSIDWGKLSNVVHNDVVEKTVSDKLVIKLNALF